MPPIQAPISKAFQETPAAVILRGIQSKDVRARWRREELVKRLPADMRGKFKSHSFMHALHEAEDEVNKLGDVGLTVSFKELQILDDNDDIFAGSGEIYVITSLLDGSGAQPDFKTKLFEGISSGDKLPLGGGGMLVGMLKNPRWFIDMHMLVMESDADIRAVGAAIEKARKDSGLRETLAEVGSLASFDPTAVSAVMNGVDSFLGLLAGLLKANGDDHIATIHDFYLKGQGFGAGRHPEKAGTLQRFQDVKVCYEINLTKL
jgi:hypothetical protein